MLATRLLLCQAYYWHVARVKSRREKALANYLFKQAIGYYLPLVKKRQASKKRVRYSLAPVFPGCLFMHADTTGRYNALRTNHIMVLTVTSIMQSISLEVDSDTVKPV